jgi:hypothetical protein
VRNETNLFESTEKKAEFKDPIGVANTPNSELKSIKTTEKRLKSLSTTSDRTITTASKEEPSTMSGRILTTKSKEGSSGMSGTLVTTERIVLSSNQMAATTDTNSTFDKENEYFDLHAESPRMYSGPIVYGWPPNKNRSVSLYIDPNDISTFLMFPNSEKRENCTMLIVVHTMPG